MHIVVVVQMNDPIIRGTPYVVSPVATEQPADQSRDSVQPHIRRYISGVYIDTFFASQSILPSTLPD
jgi:hypothetical protein